MRKTLAASVALVAALALTGCNSATAVIPKPTKQTAATEAKPPLTIPSSFTSSQAKLDFAVKANVDGYHKEIAATLEQAVKDSPTAMGYLALGSNRFSLSDYTGAISAWQQASELDKKVQGEALNNIGNALRDSHQYDQAEASYRQALEIEPTRWTAAVNLASMLEQQGDLKSAVAVLEESTPANQDVVPLQALLLAYQQKLNTTALK